MYVDDMSYEDAKMFERELKSQVIADPGNEQLRWDLEDVRGRLSELKAG